MSDPFARAATALDEALLTTPVFTSEKGLSHRRAKIERVLAVALREYLVAVRETVADVEVVRELIDGLPKPTTEKKHASKY